MKWLGVYAAFGLLSSLAFADRFECVTKRNQIQKLKVESIDGDFPYTRVAKELKISDPNRKENDELLLDARDSDDNTKVGPLTGSAARATVDVGLAIKQKDNKTRENLVLMGHRLHSYSYLELDVEEGNNGEEFKFGQQGNEANNPFDAVLKGTLERTGETVSVNLRCQYSNAKVARKKAE